MERAEGEFFLRLFLAPVPASRPRVTRWGTYYAPTYKHWKAAAEAAVPQWPDPPLCVPLEVGVEFVCKRPERPTLATPRGDIDNYMKSIFDVLTKRGYWSDDQLIARVRGIKRYAEKGEEPHIAVGVVEIIP